MPLPVLQGRGTSDRLPNRFDELQLEYEPEAEVDDDGQRRRVRTQFFVDASKSILAENDSPDLGFRYSLNPYRGCEHGCIYCYARPSHEYLSFNAGLDFETKIMVKTRAVELLRETLRKPSWQPDVIMVSGNTDCYQPCEKHFRLTRGVLELCAEARQPVAMITKSALIMRDLDVLQKLAAHNAISVAVSLTSLDRHLANKMEPRAAAPARRLEAIRALAQAGIPVIAMIGPVIPGLNDREIPALIEAAAEAGAWDMHWVLLRLAAPLPGLFEGWLRDHYPDRAEHVLTLVKDVRHGALNDTRFGVRQRGTGMYAQQIDQLFKAAHRKHFPQPRHFEVNRSAFVRPAAVGDQMSLFGK